MMLTRKGRQLGAFIGRLLALRDFHRVAVVFGKMRNQSFQPFSTADCTAQDELAPPYRQNDE